MSSLITHKLSGWQYSVEQHLLDLNRPGEVIEIIPEIIPDHWVGIVIDRRGDAFATWGILNLQKRLVKSSELL